MVILVLFFLGIVATILTFDRIQLDNKQNSILTYFFMAVSIITIGGIPSGFLCVTGVWTWQMGEILRAIIILVAITSITYIVGYFILGLHDTSIFCRIASILIFVISVIIWTAAFYHPLGDSEDKIVLQTKVQIASIEE